MVRRGSACVLSLSLTGALRCPGRCGQPFEVDGALAPSSRLTPSVANKKAQGRRLSKVSLRTAVDVLLQSQPLWPSALPRPRRSARAEPRSHDSHDGPGPASNSGGRYDATNVVSGSYGKYQIMPRVWRAWACSLSGNAGRTRRRAPRNTSSCSRISDLSCASSQQVATRRPLGLTGNADPTSRSWSNASSGYVDSVITIARLVRTHTGAAQVPARCFAQDLPLPKILMGAAATRCGHGGSTRVHPRRRSVPTTGPSAR